MLIGIHAKALSEKNPTGVAGYVRQLLRHLIRLPEADTHRFLLYLDRNTDLAGSGDSVSQKVLRWPFLWTQGRLAWELFLHKPDVFFTPQHVLPRTAPKNSVVTIHGLEFERFPDHYAPHARMYLRWVTKDAVKRAARVIAVSEATKRDLMEIYRVPEEKIAVIHHGLPLPPSSLDQVEGRLSGLTRGSMDSRLRGNDSHTPYFLYIGRIEKKKNADGIIQAFEISKSRYHLPHKLILAGGDGCGAGEIKHKAQSTKHKQDIEWLGYVSEDEKWQLLRGADAFVFPSWYEGFGLPILEAQSMGVPVITSNVSSMPEVVGTSFSGVRSNAYHHTPVYDGSRGAVCVAPGDTESIAEAMRRIAQDSVLRAALIAGGYENVKRFSWEKCAKETLQVLFAGGNPFSRD